VRPFNPWRCRGSRSPCSAVSLPFKRHPRRGAQHNLLWSGRLHVGSRHQLELNLHLSFGLTLVLVTWLLAQACLPMLFPGWPPASYWLVAAATAALDGLAGLLHELGHVGMAMASGTRVSRITLYGLSAAVRRSSGSTRSRDQALIAMAGPVSQLLLAGVLWAAWNVLPPGNEPLRVAAGLPAVSNFVAGVFNLLPVSVLDGGRAARALTTLLVRVGPPAIS
jgi:Zn-dependent protease